MPRPDRLALPAALALAALIVACDGFSDSTDIGYRYDGGGMASSPAPAAMPLIERVVGRARDAATDALAPLPAQDSTGARMLIRSAQVFVRVDSLEPAMDAVRRLATSLGGMIGDVSVSAGEMQVRTATMQLKVPVGRFDSALSGIDPLGRVESTSVSAEDVGEEFVDVSARMANSRRLEDRLVALLATRTGRLEDVLAVERELARVRQEIERYEARIRYLRTNIALSTVTVTMSERAPLVSRNPGENVIVEAFKGAWRNFVVLSAGAIRSLGFVLPLALLLWAFVRVRARSQRPREAP